MPTDVKLIYHTIYFSMFQEAGSSDEIDIGCVRSHTECQTHTQDVLSAFIHHAHNRLRHAKNCMTGSV